MRRKQPDPDGRLILGQDSEEQTDGDRHAHSSDSHPQRDLHHQRWKYDPRDDGDDPSEDHAAQPAEQRKGDGIGVVPE